MLLAHAEPAKHIEPVAPAVRIVGRAEMHVMMGRSGENIRHRVLLDRFHARAGGWRTQTLRNARTACGESLDGKYYMPTDDGYDGTLCDRGCFTAIEIRTANEWQAEDIRKADEAAAKFEAESAERWRLLDERARERQDAAMKRITNGKKPDPKDKK